LFDHLSGSVLFNDDFARAGRNVAGGDLAAWPTDPDFHRRSGRGQDLDCAVLRPVSAARMNFPRGTGLLTLFQSHHRAGAGGISGRASEPYSQPWLGLDVMKELGIRPVLRHHQVYAPVLIVVTQGRPPLFAIHFYSALLSG